MIVFKCKMCGGEMELEEGATVAECPYCMTKQTLPKLDNDKRANMYDRANHFRRQNEYDKAMAIFENILQEDRTDAEAYWSLVLCRYGIEYVEDPTTHKRVPTVNRVQYTSILADEDYKSALEYADFAQRSVYEEEAKAIDEIQKGILAISKQEKPFDVFICYKETDANGRRTPDSVLANDLYHQLTNEGFKVFFSRITLEDKIGTAYEPYIFAALNSAKVMVVLGTKPEYFNAVWVKNEWSRYLALIRAGADKTLVPAYRDMDPYDLPDEFSHLQAQDMGKLGFMQDLIRGIKKLTTKETAKPQTVIQQNVGTGANIENLMKRVRLFLEDGNFTSADEYLDRVLDENAEYAPAYIGKILVKLKLHKAEDLSQCLTEFEKDSNWPKAMRFATPEQKKIYENYLEKSKEARQEKANNDAYNKALQALENAKSSDECYRARFQFETIRSYRDSEKQIELCNEKAILLDYNRAVSMAEKATTEEECIKAAKEFERLGDYKYAKTNAENARMRGKSLTYNKAKKMLEMATTVIQCVDAMKVFQSVSDYRDAEEQMKKCREKADEILYNEAKTAFDRSHTIQAYETAKEKFQKITHVRDSVQYIEKCDSRIEEINNNDYNRALELMNSAKQPKDCEEAARQFRKLAGYRDSAAKANLASKKAIELQQKIAEDAARAEEDARRKAAKEAARKKRNKIIGIVSAFVIVAAVLLTVLVIIPKGHYDKGVSLRAEKKWDEAVQEFQQAGNYSDASTQIFATYYAEGEYRRGIQDWDGAIEAFEHAAGYNDSSSQINITYYSEGEYKKNNQDTDGAVEAFGRANGYADSTKQIESIVLEKKKSHYEEGIAKQSKKEWNEAIRAFEVADDYEDAALRIADCYYQQGMEFLDTDILKAKLCFMKSGTKDAKDQIFIINRATKDRIAIGQQHAVGLNSDGTVTCVGKNDKGQCDTSGWNDIVAVYAGGYNTFGLKKDGSVVATGMNDDGGCNVSSWNVISLSSFGSHTIGLKANGTVLGTGYKGYKGNDGRLSVSGWSNITSVSTGYCHSVGLKADGTVVAVGAKGNYRRQTDTEEWTDVVAVEAGTHCTFALRSDGTVIGTGEDFRGVNDVGDWTDIVDIAAGDCIFGLKTDGTVIHAGNSWSEVERAVDSWTDIVAINAREDNVIGLKKDGTVVVGHVNTLSEQLRGFKIK